MGDNVFGWAGQLLDKIQATVQFSEELKTIVFVFKIFTKPEMQLQKQFKNPAILTNPPNLPIDLKMLEDIVLDQDVETELSCT